MGSAAGFCAGLMSIGGGLIVVPVLAVLFAAQHIAEPLVMPMAFGRGSFPCHKDNVGARP